MKTKEAKKKPKEPVRMTVVVKALDTPITEEQRDKLHRVLSGVIRDIMKKKSQLTT